MLRRVCHFFLPALLVAGCASEPDFVPLFNGEDLEGWRIVNTDSSTWTVRDAMIVCSGEPIGELCTTRQYENFILELEWRHMTEGGNAGLFIHSDPLPAVGQPFTRAIECQVMDGNHGDVFAIHGATMVPDRPHPQGWMRSLPREERARPAGEWNHYRVESRDGTVTLAVNGEVVSGGSEIRPRKGYICLESEGAEVHFRNIRIRELPSTDPRPEETADVYRGFTTLYSGVDLSGWRIGSASKAGRAGGAASGADAEAASDTGSGASAWKSDDWILRRVPSADGGGHLWTEKAYDDFDLIVDWRAECGEQAQVAPEKTRSAVFLRGRTDAGILLGCAAAVGDDATALATVTEEGAGSRGWRRVLVRARGDRIRVEVDGAPLADRALPEGTPASGPIGLADFGAPMEFANLFVNPFGKDDGNAE